MSTQPSSRGRPSTLGTLRRLVRYIAEPSLAAGGLPASFMVAFTALAKAAPIFSAFDVMLLSVGWAKARPCAPCPRVFTSAARAPRGHGAALFDWRERNPWTAPLPTLQTS